MRFSPVLTPCCGSHRWFSLGSGLLLVLLLALAAGAGGCSSGDDDDSGDGGDDDNDAGPDDDATDDDDNNDDASPDDDDDDWNLSDPLGPGEVRAGQITAENELIGGSRARGEIGDYKIYNSQIELIIRSTDKIGVGFAGYAGNIIDADRARPPEEPGQDNLQSVEHVVGIIRGFWAQQVEVISDGHDGAAIIRAAGQDGGIQFTDSLISANGSINKQDYQLRIVNDYILEPDKDYVTIRTKVFNDADYYKQVAIADMPFWGFETNTFLPRTGFNVGDVDILAFVRWVGGLSRFNIPVSYALATAGEDARLYIPYIYGMVIPAVETLLPVSAHGHSSWERLFIVGDGDARIIASAINEHDGDQAHGTLNGQLTLAGEADYTKTQVFVHDQRPDGDNYVAMLLPDAAGKFGLELPPGQYTLAAQGEGRLDAAPVEVTIATGQTTAAELALAAPGYLAFDVVDGEGAPTACRIGLQAGHNADPEAPIVEAFFTMTGAETVPVKPGPYTVTASRGYEYEILRQNVTVTAGAAKAASFSGEIARSVDTAGWIATDFHIHGPYSTDSDTRPVKRIQEFAAEGLEMPVMTDHDYVSALWDSVTVEAGAQNLLQVVTGAEISPGIGHFNAWPMTPNPTHPDFYGLPFMLYDEQRELVRNYEFPEMWDFARADYGAETIQLNHPRDWFAYAGYDAAVGVDGVDPLRFGLDFNAIEVWNGSWNSVIEYWFSFLDQGLNFTMHGNSDSHHYVASVGVPRNLIAMPGGDDPATASVEEFKVNDRAHRAEISNGPFISFSIESQPIGALVTGNDGEAIPLRIVVQAPTWVGVDYVKVYSNHGAVVYEESIGVTGEVVRFDDTVTLDATQDAYFVVEAGHTTATMGPVSPGARTFAITNPIWVDVDGNGVFDAPGLPGAR